MPKTVDNPRYNVVSLRLSDIELDALNAVLGKRSKSSFAFDALFEKIEKEEYGKSIQTN